MLCNFNKQINSRLQLCTYSEKNKESLVLFSHTVIDPGTVMIHLPDASFTNTAGRRKESLIHDKLTANANVISYSVCPFIKYVFKEHFSCYNKPVYYTESECASVLITCYSCSACCVCMVLDWPAVVCPLRLDATALWALVDDLARLQLQALHIFLCCVTLGNCALRKRADRKRNMLFIKKIHINALCWGHWEFKHIQQFTDTVPNVSRLWEGKNTLI